MTARLHSYMAGADPSRKCGCCLSCHERLLKPQIRRHKYMFLWMRYASYGADLSSFVTQLVTEAEEGCLEKLQAALEVSAPILKAGCQCRG